MKHYVPVRWLLEEAHQHRHAVHAGLPDTLQSSDFHRLLKKQSDIDIWNLTNLLCHRLSWHDGECIKWLQENKS